MAKRRSNLPALRLRLYIAGNAPNSMRALTNVRAICEEHYAANHELEIVDVLEWPLRGLEDGVIVTPTLLRVHPQPIQRLIGNLSDLPQVLLTLASK